MLPPCPGAPWGQRSAEEEAARRDAYEAAGSDDEALARALQSQGDDRHQAFAFDDEALARRLEEEANLECVRRLAARDERDDAQLAFELERQQHEAARRAEDDFSVAARVQRELTAREEDEKAAARRRELEPPSRLTRPAEARPDVQGGQALSSLVIPGLSSPSEILSTSVDRHCRPLSSRSVVPI